MAAPTGRGRGFAVHKALDQVGAFAGPLLLAGVTALTGVLWPGLAISLTVLSVNYIGDGLRDALDPRIRGR